MKKYPLKLKPVTKSAIWGGSRIPETFGIGRMGENVAEAWMLSVRRDAVNIIENGPATGMTLADYLGIDYTREEKPDHFPLLVKILDARDKLSVQVHPDDAFAAMNGLDAGKTEMWYVLDAEKGATLVLGAKEGVSGNDIRAHALDGTLENDLRFVPVKKGDCFFIPAGMIHAIGGGILIAEIQQNSDTTYRLYDYDRVGQDGKKRELHLDAALQAIKSVFDTTAVTVNTRVPSPVGVTETILCGCDKFRAVSVSVKAGKSYGMASPSRFVHVMCVGGIGVLECGGARYQLKKGDSYFLPAALTGIGFTAERDMSLIFSEANG